jgi:hypothetical protein
MTPKQNKLERWPSSGMQHGVVWYILTDVLEELTTTLMMKAVTSSEETVNICGATQCYMPEGSHLYTRSSENLRAHTN